MKKLKFNFQGKDKIVFVTFYNEKFKKDLESADTVDFDQLDFMSEHETKSVWIGRGLGIEGSPHITSLTIDNDDEDVLQEYFGENALFLFDGDPNNEDDQKQFKEVEGCSYHSCLIGTYNDSIDISKDNRFFGDADHHKFATIEIVENYNASGTVTVEVEDDWKTTEFQIIFADVDTGGGWGDSFTQEVYRITGLEKEPLCIQYKDKLYEIDCEYEGGSNEWYYFENKDGSWEESYEIKAKFDEKMGEW